MDAEFIKWLVGQVGTAGIAAMALWMLRQSYEERLRAEQQHRADLDRLHQDTRQAVKENTQAFIDLQRIMQSLCVEIEKK